LWRLHHHYSRN